MYTLVTGLVNQWTQKDEYFILIVGLDNAGKTTLLEKIKSMYGSSGAAPLPPSQITPTVGMNVAKLDMHSTRLQFWDLGGQHSLRGLWSTYYAETHGVVFVIDSADESRLEEVQESFERVVMDDQVEGVPVLMLANKQDAENALSVPQIQRIFNRIAVSLEARDSRVMSVSALKGDGVNEAVEWLLSRIIRNRENRPPFRRP